MDILLTSKTTRTPGPEARFNCPTCGADVPATTYEVEERMGVFFIPLLTQRQTYVECSQCDTSRLTRLPLAELGRYSAEELTPHLSPRVSVVVKFLAITSLLLFFFPAVGFVLSAIAVLASYRTGGWPKRVSLIAFALSAVVSAAFAIMLLSAVLFSRK